MSGNARVGVDTSGMKNGLKEARAELANMKREFKELSSAADLLNKREEQLNQKMDATKKMIEAHNKVADEYKKKIADGEKEVEKLKDKKEELTRKLNDAKNATEKDGKAIDDLTKELKECSDELKKKEKNLEKNKNNLTATNTEVNKLQKSYNDYNKELEESTDITKLFGTQITSAQDAMDKLGDVAENVKNKVNEVTDGFENLIKEGIQETAKELTELAKITEDYGTKSETALAKAQTLLTGDMYDGANGLIRDQTKLFGQDYSDIAEGWYQALSAAVPNDKIADFTEVAGKLAISGFTDSSTSIDALTTIINAFKLSHDEAAKLASVLINTQNLGKTTVGELGQDIASVASTASLSGVSFYDLMTATSYSTQGGIKTNETMTALNSMIRELSDITSTSSKVLIQNTGKTFKELMSEGYNLRDVLQILGNAGDSAATILGEEFIITKSKLDESLFEKADSVEEVLAIAKQNGADLSTSVQDLFSNIRAAKVAGALFDQTNQQDYSNRLLGNENLDSNLLEQQFEHLINTTENQKNILKQIWQDALVEMWMGGEATEGLQGYIGEALAEVNDLSNELIDDFDFSLIDEIGQTIKDVIIGICNIVRDNKGLIMDLINSLGDFIIQLVEYLPTVVEDVIPALMEFVDGLLDKAPTLLNFLPAIIDIMTFIINNLPLIMGVLYTIQGIFSILGAVFEIGGIVIALEVLAEWLGTTIPAVAGAAGGAIAGLAGPIGIAIAAITAIITFFVIAYNKSELFRSALGDLIDRISGALAEAVNSIVDAFNDFLEVIGLTDAKIDLLGEGIGILAAGISGILGDSVIMIINIFEGLVEHVLYTIELFDLFGKIVRGTFAAIVTGDWSGVISNIKTAMNTALKDVMLPLKVLIETADEIENKTKKTTTTNKTTITNTPSVDIDTNKLIADVKNFNSNVSTVKTPVVNNNNKNVTSNNYFYSPSALDERMIDKNLKNTLNEALFTSA